MWQTKCKLQHGHTRSTKIKNFLKSCNEQIAIRMNQLIEINQKNANFVTPPQKQAIDILFKNNRSCPLTPALPSLLAL